MTIELRGILAAGGLAIALAAPAAADMTEDEAAIEGIWDTYAEARVAGDAETWLSLWDEDGIRMVPGGPAVDYATFAPGTPARFEKPPASMKIMAEEIEIAGDWAYSRGTFVVNDALEGKFLTILRRQEDGSWRIYRDAFNFNSE